MIDQPICRAAPKVSVLMTVYNADLYLEEAVDSLINQTYGEWELIVIENGSSDNSPQILESYQDKRIRVFSLPENIGRTQALRLAFTHAAGEYIAVLDADDVSNPNRMLQEVEYLDKHPEIGLVGTWAEQIDEHGDVMDLFCPANNESDLHDLLGWSNPFVHSSIMYRSSIAKRVSGYPSDYFYAQDYALILKIEKEALVGMIAEPLCKWRVVKTSMTRSSKHALIIARELFELSKLAGQRNFLKKSSIKIAAHRQAVLQLKLGLLLIKNMEIINGFVLVLAAAIKKPSCLLINGFTERFTCKWKK